MVHDILVMLYDLLYTVHDVSPSKDVSCCPRSIFDAIFVDFGREMEASWHPKRSKIEAAGSSLGALGGLPGRLGSVLDRLRGLLGSGGGQRRGECQLLGVSWAVLGASWGNLGAPRGHLGVFLRANMVP